MAEFKLGRIRFIWKGTWAPSTIYYKDDIVRDGGNTYVCIGGHTSTSDFTTDATTYWNKISDGQEWKSDWLTSTYYKVNDIVKYNGNLYIANAAHTSAATIALGLEDDQAKWDLFAEGFDYRAAWALDTRYIVNDIVKYNGTIYICTEAHTSTTDSALGLETDQSKWDIFSEGFYWSGNWIAGLRYKVNDVVKYGGTLYVCNQGHTAAASNTLGLEADQSKWDHLHKGIEFLGNWTAATRYKINDIVKYGGGIWICTTYHTSTTSLAADESNWAQFVEGLEFEDSWSATANYQPGDFVTYGGYSYVSATNNLASKPTLNPSDWQLFTTGFNWRGDYDDDADSTAQDYRVGDVVRVGGYTYLCITDHLYDDEIAGDPGYSGYRPSSFENGEYWVRLNSGIEWKNTWTDAVYYDEGDSVSYGVNSYICIRPHTSDEIVDQNRPDQDVSGTYWNILSGGPETGNLTTEGDLVYYGGAGPTRLPIGESGQVLKVNQAANAPEWGYFGRINNVWYVSTSNGLDLPPPAYGTTLDRPWKTVRYAAEQILKGGLLPNARHLLELNKSFIQEEVVEWVAAQIAGGTGIWTGFVNDDEALCRRDMGLILDAIVYDLGQGGNVRSRAAALSYFNEGSLIAAIADEDEQLVAALDYMIEVIDAVISNLSPATTYSSFSQYTNSDYTEESTAQTLVESLIGIITDAVTANNTAGIPAERKPNNTIFVKTGEHAEVLPIIVPENCAVVGDELRSTRIVPAGSLVDSADTPYSLDAMTRLQTIISDVIQNNAVTKTTTGASPNTETQVTTHPAGSAAAGLEAQELVQQIYDYIDYGVNGATGDSTIPLSTGSNTPVTTTDYTYAVETLEANRAFIKAEILAYIADTYPAYTYDSAKCARDVDRYLDAIEHDLIYTGNYKSLLAARYYVNAVNGSLTEDMFYMRNGTGLRNCTVAGLTGTLSSANEYGTQRPSAGAFVSLDPGWGPNHQEVWINTKSPYVQNVTTFGTACVGLKVDGNLHAGGNDSIVANDFTQVISDGIGAWVTNLGRAELVSVFSYYAHIGYLAENGGKIRATNGNSSYGTFGCVAEGVDDTEVPITGTVNNYSFEAVISRVFTDGSEIQVLEFVNAGVGYTEATDAITAVTSFSPADENRVLGTYYDVTGTSSGAGTGQQFTINIDAAGSISSIEITKGGSGHAPGDTITINDADLGGGGAANLTFDVDTVGAATQWSITGEGYGTVISATNVVDGGVFEVRLLDSGEDFGGADYLSAENVAQGGTNTTITISNTDLRLSTQYIGMAIFITSGKGAGQYAKIDTYNSGTKIIEVVKFSDGTPGWDHVVPGTAIETTLDDTSNYSIEPAIEFTAPPSSLYADTAKGRAIVEDGKIVRITLWDPGSGYLTPPTMTTVDPNNTLNVPHEVRIGDGVLTQPTWSNRGLGFVTAQATVTGDGYADLYQPGNYIQVRGMTEIPRAGANVEFSGISNTWYKLVSVTQASGLGPYTVRLQVSPEISITDAPEHADDVTIRIRYSQVRLTGHDFLDIGTGNFADTNYPGVPVNNPDPAKETRNFGGGRVFYTSTDQDGNFRVGELFSVEQSTGVATLNADAFNISGLQELQLGTIELGGTGAVITEFSTDGTFTANSDNVVPTQKAIRTYIASQIGGGAGELNVNSITAGSIFISTNEITTTTGAQINVIQKLNLEAGIDGHPLAMNYFLQS